MSGTGTGTKASGTSIAGGLVIAPAVEPVSLAELKLHLRLDSGSFADNIDETLSIAPGNHIVADNYTTHAGAAIEVLGYTVLVNFAVGVLTVGGTVDVKVQDSDDKTIWTDWGTAFAQVTISATKATYEKAYTGTKRYIRTVAKVLVQNSEFSTSVIRLTATSIEDDLLTALITTCRQHVEAITRRALITQTWDLFFNEFPDKDYIKLPFGQLQDVISITYTDSEGTPTIMVVTADYLKDISSEPGRIVLPYGASWPSFTPYPVNPIAIRFKCGYGDTSDKVPVGIRTAIKMFAADLYENRETKVIGQTIMENKAAENLLGPFRLWSFA